MSFQPSGGFQDRRFSRYFSSPHAYPVYRADEESDLRRARMQLEASGLILAGRQGRFDYLSSDMVARRSRELAASIS